MHQNQIHRLQRDELLSDLGSAEKSYEAFLTQQAVVSDEAGQIRGVSWRLVDRSMGLQLFADQPYILRFTLVYKRTHTEAMSMSA